MGGFFNLDGPFYKWGTEVADIMILSLLWLIFSLPIFTIGASTTALFYVCGKKVRKEDPYIFKSFLSSFKNNFKQGTVLTLVLGLLWFSVYLYYKIITSGNAQVWLQIMGLFYMIQVLIITLYLFPVLSRFEMTIKNLLITSFILANRHLPTTILCSVLFLGVIIAVITPTPIAIFAFGIYGIISSYFFQRIFTRHIGEMKTGGQFKQEDTEELEEEENERKLED